MRSTGLACCRVLVIAMLPAGAFCRVGAAQNLAYDKQYQCNTEILPDWTGLTDGVKDSDQAPACFATDSSPEFPKEIIIDLDIVCKVTRIVVTNSLNGNTRHIAVWTSPTLEDFEKLREYYFPPKQVQPLVHSFEARQARYIKISLYDSWGQGLQGGNCLYLREVEVYGDKTGSGEPGKSAADVLRLAALQPPLFAPHSVRLFQRYCLQNQQHLAVGVLGDSFACRRPEGPEHWCDLLAQGLRGADESREVKVRNLARPGQTPHKAVELLDQLKGPEPVDILIIAYGFDAARAGMATARFRGECQYLLQEARKKLPALIVVVTPWPWAGPADFASPGQGKQTTRHSQIIGEVGSREGCAVVRTAAVLGRRAKQVPQLYEDDLAASPEAHQTLAGALMQLLELSPISE